jgi:large subunit ribosomal protein L6
MADAATPLPVSESRIGKRLVPIPDGVEVKLDGRRVSVKGPKGSSACELPGEVVVQVQGKSLRVTPPAGAGRRGKREQGLARALLNSMLEGAAKGYLLSMDLVGVGYRAEVKGHELNLALGLSHPVRVTLPPSVKAQVETIDEAGVKRPRLLLTSSDKQVLGETAARIRALRPPEPYKGKGIRFTGEKLREKAGKAAAGSKKT